MQSNAASLPSVSALVAGRKGQPGSIGAERKVCCFRECTRGTKASSNVESPAGNLWSVDKLVRHFEIRILSSSTA